MTAGRKKLDEVRDRYHELRAQPGNSTHATRARRAALRTYGLRVIAELSRYGVTGTDLNRRFGLAKWTYDDAYAVLLELEEGPRDLEEVLQEGIDAGIVPTGRKPRPDIIQGVKDAVFEAKARQGHRYGARR